jgi:hypothetical protein
MSEKRTYSYLLRTNTEHYFHAVVMADTGHIVMDVDSNTLVSRNPGFMNHKYDMSNLKNYLIRHGLIENNLSVDLQMI